MSKKGGFPSVIKFHVLFCFCIKRLIGRKCSDQLIIQWLSNTLNLWITTFKSQGDCTGCLVEGNRSPNKCGQTQTDCNHSQTDWWMFASNAQLIQPTTNSINWDQSTPTNTPRLWCVSLQQGDLTQLDETKFWSAYLILQLIHCLATTTSLFVEEVLAGLWM